MNTIFLSDFVKKFKKFDIDFHENEIELLHYLLWKDLNFLPLTVKSLFELLNVLNLIIEG